MFKIKDHAKITAKELNETEKSNMHHREFKVMVVKILTGIKKRLEVLIKIFNKEIENI